MKVHINIKLLAEFLISKLISFAHYTYKLIFCKTCYFLASEYRKVSIVSVNEIEGGILKRKRASSFRFRNTLKTFSATQHISSLHRYLSTGYVYSC